MAQERIKATIKRISSSPNKFNQFTYVLVNTDEKQKPKNLKMYGRQAEYLNKVFYLPQMLGTLDEENEVNIAYAKRVSQSTGEEFSQILVLRSEEDKRLDEEATLRNQNIRKQARREGINMQQFVKLKDAVAASKLLGMNEIQASQIILTEMSKAAFASNAPLVSAVNGPTTQNQPPFQWSTSVFNSQVHIGQPDLFDFDFVEMEQNLH
jgi:hypothetical protein